jgi:hypothetical protein
MLEFTLLAVAGFIAWSVSTIAAMVVSGLIMIWDQRAVLERVLEL